MENRTRKGAAAVTLAVTFLCVARPAVADEPSAGGAAFDTTISRVRSDSPTLAAAIGEAARHSATFRDIVAAIETSDGLVYVQEGRCVHGVRSCLLFSVTVAGPYRLLRVRVDPRLASEEVMGLLGHELRHAVEVLSDPQVRSDKAIHFLYLKQGLKLGSTATGVFETEAAIEAGRAVRAEVRASY
jgi:hypothetical protein